MSDECFHSTPSPRGAGRREPCDLRVKSAPKDKPPRDSPLPTFYQSVRGPTASTESRALYVSNHRSDYPVNSMYGSTLILSCILYSHPSYAIEKAFLIYPKVLSIASRLSTRLCIPSPRIFYDFQHLSARIPHGMRTCFFPWYRSVLYGVSQAARTVRSWTAM